MTEAFELQDGPNQPYTIYSQKYPKVKDTFMKDNTWAYPGVLPIDRHVLREPVLSVSSQSTPAANITIYLETLMLLLQKQVTAPADIPTSIMFILIVQRKPSNAHSRAVPQQWMFGGCCKNR